MNHAGLCAAFHFALITAPPVRAVVLPALGWPGDLEPLDAPVSTWANDAGAVARASDVFHRFAAPDGTRFGLHTKVLGPYSTLSAQQAAGYRARAAGMAAKLDYDRGACLLFGPRQALVRHVGHAASFDAALSVADLGIGDTGETE